MAGELGYVRVRSGEFLAGGVVFGPFGLVKFWYVSAGELGFVNAWQVSLRCVFILVRQVWCGASVLGGSGYVQV